MVVTPTSADSWQRHSWAQAALPLSRIEPTSIIAIRDGSFMPPRLSVIICSFNGAVGVDRCMRTLAKQTIYSELEIIVSDDGSTDNTSEIARAHDAAVIRHVPNRGVSAARNSGVQLASAPIVAFIDDDCVPDPQWAEQLLSGYDDKVIATGGPLVVDGEPGLIVSYLTRHNPLEPQELELAKSSRLSYRLYLYLRRQWRAYTPQGRREVFSFASANMSVRRQEFLDIGGFDERFRFGAEDDDLCRRLRHRFPEGRLLFLPEARVRHYFKASLRDTLRRRCAYGRGSARLYRKWPSVRPTFFPSPLIVLAMLALSVRVPLLFVATAALPQLLYPRGIRAAVASLRIECLLDGYLQLLEESGNDIGFLTGLWCFRHLVPEPRSGTVPTLRPRGDGERTELVLC
jgi:glycosyltransferase involved in cell wall biosynthesis